MNKPSDTTKLVLKKSKKYLFFKVLISIVYRAIAMITPILFSQVVNHVTNGDYKSAFTIASCAVFVVIILECVILLILISRILKMAQMDSFTTQK